MVGYDFILKDYYCYQRQPIAWEDEIHWILNFVDFSKIGTGQLGSIIKGSN